MKSKAFGTMAFLLLTGCGATASRPTIEQVKNSHEGSIMAIKGVTGVGIGNADGSRVIKVFLESSSPEPMSAPPVPMLMYCAIKRNWCRKSNRSSSDVVSR